MYKLFSALILVSFILAGCQSAPEIQTGPDAEVIGDNLHRVDNSRVAMGYVDPDVDFSKYTAVLILPLGVDNVEIVQPSGYPSRPGGNNWELTDRDKDTLRTTFNEVMTDELSKGESYSVATDIGDKVLAIAARLTAIAPTAPKDDFSSRAVGRSRIYSEGAGSIAVEFAFVDSETGAILALAKDSRSGNSTWGVNNSVSNRAEVQRMFRAWATQIRSSLDNVHGKE